MEKQCDGNNQEQSTPSTLPNLEIPKTIICSEESNASKIEVLNRLNIKTERESLGGSLSVFKNSNDSELEFESRKKDHIKLSMDAATEAEELNQLNRIRLLPNAVPEINYSEVNFKTRFWNHESPVPFFISSMTAGHAGGTMVNLELARLSHETGIVMAVGSQRRQLFDAKARGEWLQIRQQFPNAKLMGNIGLTQLIESGADAVIELVESLGSPLGMFVHTNPLQEALQPEGTPQFRNGIRSLRELCSKAPFPVVLKEVGCGLTFETLKSLNDVGLAAVDISGVGGTHWGRIESMRLDPNSEEFLVAQSFLNWGQSAVETLIDCQNEVFQFELWASGGVRSGLDVCKLLALGAKKIGVARPFLGMALSESPELALDKMLSVWSKEIHVAMFCMGLARIEDFSTKKVWSWEMK